jgi:AMP-activated protein kinase-like protein
MNGNETDKLKNLLGDDFSAEEIEALTREDSLLASSAENLTALFQKAREENVPPLSSDFTARTMARISPPGFLQVVRERFLTFRILTVAGACALSFLVGIFLAPQFFRSAPPLSLSIREGVGPHQEKVYYVRFITRQPGARTVSVAGDFNQWDELPLTPVDPKKGIFSVEIPLSVGTYNYSFFVDQKKWVVDTSADRIVEDGFGNKNSVINL